MDQAAIYSLDQKNILDSLFSSYLHDKTDGGVFSFKQASCILLEVKM